MQRYEQEIVPVDVESWVKDVISQKPTEIYEHHF